MREKINENQKIPAWATFKKILRLYSVYKNKVAHHGRTIVVALRCLSDDYLSICFRKVTSVDRMDDGMT